MVRNSRSGQGGRSGPRTGDAAAWYRRADSGVPTLARGDGWERTGVGSGKTATSSCARPSVVAAMLADLDVHPGQRILEIGTGTGWNAALMAYRVGAENVVSVEVDPAVAEQARQALRRNGLGGLRVITGDGLLGYPPAAPYDRVIATCGLRSGMPEWVRQTVPGGIILVPWGTCFSPTEATARLVVAGDGARASGHFTRPVTFMPMRSQRLARPEHSAYVPARGTGDADRSTTTVTAAEFLTGASGVEAFAVGLRVPHCTRTVGREQDGKRPVWFYSRTDLSWAVVVFRDGAGGGDGDGDGGDEAIVRQSGERRLWDEVEAAFRWWQREGRPGFDRFGLTVTADGQFSWLDDPSQVLSR